MVVGGGKWLLGEKRLKTHLSGVKTQNFSGGATVFGGKKCAEGGGGGGGNDRNVSYIPMIKIPRFYSNVFLDILNTASRDENNIL